jgi:hypothetical protein
MTRDQVVKERGAHAGRPERRACKWILGAALASVGALVPAAGRAASPGPYEVKSGYLEMKDDAFGNGKTVVWFDDYGRREVRRSTSVIEMFGRRIETANVSIRTPERSVEYSPAKKKGRVSAGSAAAQTDPRALTDPKLRERYNVEELPDRVVLGRTCKGTSMEVMKGWPIRAWTWKGIPLLTQTRLGGGMVTLEAVKLDVDVEVPQSLFDVPNDVKLSK